MLRKMWCWLLGHQYQPNGWKSGGPDMIINLWACRRCQSVYQEGESWESLKSRYAAYRKEYGNAVVYDPWFYPTRRED